MRRALLFCAAIVLAIACGDNVTEPIPDRTPTVDKPLFATTTTEDGLSISTDKDDYAPGDTVHFTGTGWESGDVLDIQLDDDPAIHPPHTWTVAVGTDGTFHDSTYVVDTDDLGIVFTLTATSRATGRSLSVTFTDAAEGDVTSVIVTPVAVTGGFKLQVQVTGDIGKNQAWRTTAYQIQAAQPSNGGTFGTCIDKDPDVIGPTGSGNPPPVSGTQSFEIPGPFAAGSSGTVWIRIRALACGTNNPNDGQWDDTNGQFSIPSKLAFTTAAFSLQVNTCSASAITVQTQNANNGPANPTSDLTVNLSSSSGGTFYPSAGCSTAAISSVQIPTTGNTASFFYKNSQVGNATITASATGLTSASLAVNITAAPNTAPTVDAGGPYSGDEGSAIPINGASATDPDAGDPLTISWTYAANSGVTHTCTFSPDPANIINPSLTCNDNGSGVLTLTVSDGGGHTVTKTANLSVANVAPTATGLTTNSPVNEGSDIIFNVAGATDQSSVDAGSLRYAFDCGGGYSAATYAAASPTNSFHCSTDDNGSRTVKGKVFDKDGGVSAEQSATVEVNNVPPTATFNAPSPVNEGSDIGLSLTNADDVSSVDKAAGFTYAFDCGDGAGYSAFGAAASRNCPTTDNGSRSVGGKIKDKDGGVREYTETVQVVNVPPTIVSLTNLDGTPLPSTIFVAGTLPIKVNFTDPGTGDTHTATIDCDNGAGPVNVDGGANVSTGFQTSCTFPSIGTDKVITVTVTDDDGGAGTKTHKITVTYNFSGFFAPVDRPNTVNLSKVGQAIPLKWRLTDALGHPVTDVTSVAVKAEDFSCGLAGSTDMVEEYAAGLSGLQNLGDGYYQFNWKTPTGYLNSCKKISLVFGTGGIGYTEKPGALFTFKK